MNDTKWQIITTTAWGAAVALGVFVFGALAVAVRAGELGKTWVNVEGEFGGNQVLFIQDRETGTRCYAITNARINSSGYAISCVPRGPDVVRVGR